MLSKYQDLIPTDNDIHSIEISTIASNLKTAIFGIDLFGENYPTM
jgi:hypothetical protein